MLPSFTPQSNADFPSPLTHKIKDNASRFRILLFVELVVLAPLLFYAPVWIVIQLLSVLLGFYAIWSEVEYNPIALQIYFLVTVAGTIFACVNAALCVSSIIETRSLSVILIVGLCLWILSIGVLVSVSIKSWMLYKELLECIHNAVMNYQTSSSSFNPTYTAPSQNPPPVTSKQAEGFIPFKGYGQKLGS